MCIIPGLIDGHTHPVWDGDRVHEFAMKVSKVYTQKCFQTQNFFLTLAWWGDLHGSSSGTLTVHHIYCCLYIKKQQKVIKKE